MAVHLPEENIATVNYVAFPKDVPVQFKLTSDNIMNAFFIPRLGTQIYAMPGMVTKLNLIANHTGDYKGFASNYSGKGFSQMKFTAAAMEDRTAFLNWVQQVKASLIESKTGSNSVRLHHLRWRSL